MRKRKKKNNICLRRGAKSLSVVSDVFLQLTSTMRLHIINRRPFFLIFILLEGANLVL